MWAEQTVVILLAGPSQWCTSGPGEKVQHHTAEGNGDAAVNATRSPAEVCTNYLV